VDDAAGDKGNNYCSPEGAWSASGFLIIFF
jgi:hypothetical protein